MPDVGAGVQSFLARRRGKALDVDELVERVGSGAGPESLEPALRRCLPPHGRQLLAHVVRPNLPARDLGDDTGVAGLGNRQGGNRNREECRARACDVLTHENVPASNAYWYGTTWSACAVPGVE